MLQQEAVCHLCISRIHRSPKSSKRCLRNGWLITIEPNDLMLIKKNISRQVLLLKTVATLTGFRWFISPWFLYGWDFLFFIILIHRKAFGTELMIWENPCPLKRPAASGPWSNHSWIVMWLCEGWKKYRKYCDSLVWNIDTLAHTLYKSFLCLSYRKQ